MAKQYRALSNIEHGEEKIVDGVSVNEIVRFPHGSVVEGLDKDTMKALWDAGVLEEVDTTEPVVTRTVTPSPSTPSGTSASSTSSTSSAGEGDGSGSSPAAPGSSTEGSPKP